MNKNGLRKNNNTLYFKKWSRKAYAIFASLGVAVIIGQLSTDVAQWLSEVNGQTNIQDEQYLKISDGNDEENDEEQLQVEVLAVAATSADGCETFVNIQLEKKAVKYIVFNGFFYK